MVNDTEMVQNIADVWVFEYEPIQPIVDDEVCNAVSNSPEEHDEYEESGLGMVDTYLTVHLENCEASSSCERCKEIRNFLIEQSTARQQHLNTIMYHGWDLQFLREMDEAVPYLRFEDIRHLFVEEFGDMPDFYESDEYGSDFDDSEELDASDLDDGDSVIQEEPQLDTDDPEVKVESEEDDEDEEIDVEN
ncbi:uncharacterized protein LOC143914711 [Arctopsyche grandis]|uniref:uncharacterized protein LOC143914711 n=1 Tax=Arctopsyche grandis TaxID=121162 RepID=UPI00406D6E3E